MWELFGIADDASAQSPNDVQDFTSHGVHVILRTSNANQVIGAILGFEGGLAYGETDNASVAEGTAALIAASGSDTYPKSAYRDSLGALSTTIAGSGNLYHTTFTLRTIRPSFNSAWNIFADLLTHPHYDTLEAEKIKEQAMKAIEGRESDPESYSAFLADSLWKGTSRLNRVATEDEVSKLTIADLQSYRNNQFQRSRMVLVMVEKMFRKIKPSLPRSIICQQGISRGQRSQRSFPLPINSSSCQSRPDFPTTYVDMRAPSDR